MGDDDNKRSWREIDAAKDRGIRFPKKQPSKLEERAQKAASKSARQELEKLFSSSKLSKDKAQKLSDILSLRGKPEYYEKLVDYFQEHGLPHEWEAQVVFLDHRDSNFVIQVLDQLLKTAPKENMQRQQLLAAKLKVMSLSTFDSRLLDKIKELQTAIFSR